MEEKQALLDVKHLFISFTQYEKGLRQTELPVIRDLNVTVNPGELTAVIGSSGSGKSLLAHDILGVLPYNAKSSGMVVFQGEKLDEKRKKELRGKEIVLVPQNVSYLDPLMKVGNQIRNGKKDDAVMDRCLNILKRYGLTADTARLYPFQLSGGMTRRVLISTAVMEKPKLVIADEPTPGLDAKASKRVLGHFREMADEGAGVLLITHDLEAALEVADKIVVFYAGYTVEECPASDFMKEETLRHPYTKALYQAMPCHGFIPAKGTQPYAKQMPVGCPYMDRCQMAKNECQKEIPYRKLRGGHVRCIQAI